MKIRRIWREREGIWGEDIGVGFLQTHRHVPNSQFKNVLRSMWGIHTVKMMIQSCGFYSFDLEYFTYFILSIRSFFWKRLN